MSPPAGAFLACLFGALGEDVDDGGQVGGVHLPHLRWWGAQFDGDHGDQPAEGAVWVGSACSASPSTSTSSTVASHFSNDTFGVPGGRCSSAHAWNRNEVTPSRPGLFTSL